MSVRIDATTSSRSSYLIVIFSLLEIVIMLVMISAYVVLEVYGQHTTYLLYISKATAHASLVYLGQIIVAIVYYRSVACYQSNDNSAHRSRSVHIVLGSMLVFAAIVHIACHLLRVYDHWGELFNRYVIVGTGFILLAYLFLNSAIRLIFHRWPNFTLSLHGNWGFVVVGLTAASLHSIYFLPFFLSYALLKPIVRLALVVCSTIRVHDIVEYDNFLVLSLAFSRDWWLERLYLRTERQANVICDCWLICHNISRWQRHPFTLIARHYDHCSDISAADVESTGQSTLIFTFLIGRHQGDWKRRFTRELVKGARLKLYDFGVRVALDESVHSLEYAKLQQDSCFILFVCGLEITVFLAYIDFIRYNFSQKLRRCLIFWQCNDLQLINVALNFVKAAVSTELREYFSLKLVIFTIHKNVTDMDFVKLQHTGDISIRVCVRLLLSEEEDNNIFRVDDNRNIGSSEDRLFTNRISVYACTSKHKMSFEKALRREQRTRRRQRDHARILF